MFCERRSPVSSAIVTPKRSQISSWIRSIETCVLSPCGKTSLSTSWASSTVSGRPVSDENATTRVSAPSSSRMFVETRAGDERQELGVADLDLVVLHLLAQDRDARLQVGRLDVGDQPPLEPRAQALLERRDLARRPVGGHHDLAAGLVERVERVEELLLDPLLVLEELHVVDQEDVVGAVALLEPLDALVAKAVDEVVHERLGGDVAAGELKTIEDWVVERSYRSVHGVADDSGFGGMTMQYQVLLDPSRIYGYHLTVPQVTAALAANNANTGGGFYSQGGQFYYVRGIGLVRNIDDIGNIVVGANKGVPVRVRDIGEVTIGHAPRLGQFGFQKNDDAVEGVILMLRGEQTQNVLKDVEKKTDELNHQILPPDVKIHPFYDRSQLVDLTTETVEANLLRGMVLVLIVLIFFLVSFRAAIIVAVTIPLSLLFAFIVLHAHDVAANLLSIGAIDFGIVIDGTVVMIENIYRELALREGQEYKLDEVILAAAKDVDRPIFYSVAVILAGYLPIYALTGPAGKLFHPMAETMSFALVGALILTLTLIPVLASYWFRGGVHEKPNRAYEWMKQKYAIQLDRALARPKTTLIIRSSYLRRMPVAGAVHWRRVYAPSG